MSTSPTLQQWRGPALWLALVLPPLRHALESTMTLQMLVQIPLLALAGWWLRPRLPERTAAALARWNRSGVTGLVVASLAAMFWMIPRVIDAALDVWWVEAAKLGGVPLLIGWPLATSWPRAGFVVRGVFLMEVIATAFRVGWLYLVSPQRLCSNYLLSDQQWLGKLLLAIGAAVGLVLIRELLWGRIEIGDPTQRSSER